MPIGQSSFRRILLSRLLLVSVPVLLLGVYVTYRKARSAFLETARQNLTESAIRKADSIHQTLETFSAYLLTASESAALQSGSPRARENFLWESSARFPGRVNSVVLLDIETGAILYENSRSPGGGDDKAIPSIEGLPLDAWRKPIPGRVGNSREVFVRNLWRTGENRVVLSDRHQLELVLAAPVYDRSRRLQSVLIWQTSLLYRESVQPGSLSGYPIVIAQDGTILAHPYRWRIGRNIEREADPKRLEILIDNAIKGRRNFLHFFSLDRDGEEMVAGYSALPSPIAGESGQKWVVLAVSPVNTVLSPLRQIWEAILYLVSALLLASLSAILLIARDLARPLEKLRDYALNIENIHSKQRLPRDFGIREFNQLSSALQEMIERLRAWGEEVMVSWQEAQHANRLKDEFLATTSHELRTPLNGIIGCIRCVKDGLCDNEEEEREFLQQAEEGAVHLLGIINDILDIAKIEAGKQCVNLEIVNLHQIVTEAIALQAVQIQRKKLRLVWRENPEALKIYADPSKLKQVLLNVLSNATKFTDAGEISIAMGVREGNAVVTVSDTGIGIAPGQQSRLFRPFVMIDGSTTRKFGGTGLGLAISKNLMEMMLGKIALFSRGQGMGTTVEITIPLAEHETDIPDPDRELVPKLPIT